MNYHFNWGAYMIEEQIDFSRTVEAVVEWVYKNSSRGETPVIVTADHDTGYIYGPGSNEERQNYLLTINNKEGQCRNIAPLYYMDRISWRMNTM